MDAPQLESPNGGVRVRAAELPPTSLLDLWRRTRSAHADLFETWHRVASERFGRALAEQLADHGWPQRRRGAQPARLFSDDLRFTIAVVGLEPGLLTVADWDEALVPEPLRCRWRWYRALRAGAALRPSPPAPDPAHPGTFQPSVERLKKQAQDRAFRALLAGWRRSDARDHPQGAADPLERVAIETLPAPALALLFNLASIAYMMGTDRWYTALEQQRGSATARETELAVWTDARAADRDLEIGLAVAGRPGHASSAVETLLRGFARAPGEVGILDVELELKSPDHGVLTHRACPAVRRLEHLDDERLRHCCHICEVAMPMSGRLVDEAIECRPLQLPPRRGPRDYACRWEYRRRRDAG